jgi:glutathione S-transferase
MSNPRLLLVSFHLCPYVQRALTTLNEKGLPFEQVYIDLADKPQWFLEISPLGKVPVLQANGTAIFESSVICEFLEEIGSPSMLPREPIQRALHRSYMEMASNTLNVIAGLYSTQDTDLFDTKLRLLKDRLLWLEGLLGDAPFLLGPTLGIADAAWAPVFRYLDAFQRLAGLDLVVGSTRLPRYRSALLQAPSVRQSVPADYEERLDAFLRNRNGALISKA